MNYPRVLIIALLAFLAVINAQREDKEDKNEDEPTRQPSFAPSVFDDIDLFDDAIDSNSTEFSEAPSVMPIDSVSTPPTTTPSSSPSAGGPSAIPDPEDCAGQSCDIDDINACNCRSGLECRQRGIGQFICSQVSRTERTRLSAAAGIGGAAGRERRARIPGIVRG